MYTTIKRSRIQRPENIKTVVVSKQDWNRLKDKKSSINLKAKQVTGLNDGTIVRVQQYFVEKDHWMLAIVRRTYRRRVYLSR